MITETSLRLELMKLSNLIEQAGKGKTEAFGEIYNTYFDPIYRFLYYRVSHKETAEDLAEEVFIKALNGLKSLKDYSLFEPWLYRIARNALTDHYRKAKEVSNIDDLAEVLGYDQGIQENIDSQFAATELAKAIEALTIEEKQIVQLRFIEKLESEVVAEIMNKSAGNIRVIQHRALNKLKKELDNSQFRN